MASLGPVKLRVLESSLLNEELCSLALERQLGGAFVEGHLFLEGITERYIGTVQFFSKPEDWSLIQGLLAIEA